VCDTPSAQLAVTRSSEAAKIAAFPFSVHGYGVPHLWQNSVFLPRARLHPSSIRTSTTAVFMVKNIVTKHFGFETVLAKLREKLLGWKEQLLPKHPMEEAINYALNQWAELNVLCSDGAVPLDNNVFEREMKRVVLTRKNSLFVGNSRGGQTVAILASLTSTCRRHDVDPQLYLTRLLMNLPTARMHELSA
jgi:hypothetical protein